MKIAVFHNLSSGGAKRALYNVLNHLVRAGHLIDAFIPTTADESFCPLNEIVTGYHIFPVRRTAIAAVSYPLRRLIQYGPSLAGQARAQRCIARAINAGGYDVVYCEQDRYTVSPVILRYLARPSLYYCDQPSRRQEAILQAVRTCAEGANRLQRYGQRLLDFRNIRRVNQDRQNASFASYIVTNSYFSREVILRAYGLHAFVSYLGTDIDLFRPLFETRENYVLSVGTCGPHKGYDFLIRSLGRMHPQVRPKLVIASDVTDFRWEAYLLRLAGKLGVDLRTKRFVSDSELVGLYNKAKLFVYAPYLEPFGLAPLEAMACGTPVIAVKEGGVRESVFHNETGILTERDEEAFAQATAELLRDDAQRERLGRRGLEVVRSFWTWGHAAERLERHLRRAASLTRG